MSANLEALRKRFPVLSRKTYLNSGSYCALADSVRDAINAYMDDRLIVGANWDVWVMKNEAVRANVAQLLGADPNEIAVTASASAGINALASAMRFDGPRKKIVVSDFEFPTSAQIWHAQEPCGARVVHVPVSSDGYIPTENFARIIDEQTQLVAITQVCFRNGARLDVPGIVRLARAKCARVLLDCYQGVGTLGIDVRKLDVDYAVGGMLKYLLGTAGIGFLYVRKELIQDLVPTNSGWFAQEEIAAMDITANRPSPTARRFEAGTPAVVNCYAAEAGLKLILEAGVGAIEERVRMLTRRCLDGLSAMDWQAVTPNDDSKRGPMVAVPATNPAQLVAALAEQDIVTSFRDSNLRATIHFYNSEADIDCFLKAMRARRQSHHPEL
jgi:selenocysteine lyase/cysteine desulfurase